MTQVLVFQPFETDAPQRLLDVVEYRSHGEVIVQNARYPYPGAETRTNVKYLRVLEINPNPENREILVRALRKLWTEMTGLRTYSISWIRAHDDYELFTSDLPYNDSEERAVEEVIEATDKETAILLTTERRRTRMTISLPRPV